MLSTIMISSISLSILLNINNKDINKASASLLDEDVTITYTVNTSDISIFGSALSNVNDTYENSLTLTSSNGYEVEVPFVRTLNTVNKNKADSVTSTSNGYVKLGASNEAKEELEFNIVNLGEVKSITLISYSPNLCHSVDIYVGGNSCYSTNLGNANSSATKTCNNINKSGDICIDIHNGNNTSNVGGLYFKSISITFTPKTLLNPIEGLSPSDSDVIKAFNLARYINVKMNMSNVCSGTHSNINDAWTAISNKYNNISNKEGLNSILFKVDTTNGWDSGSDRDELQQAIKTYEYCVNYKGLSPFLDSVRPLNNTRYINNVINNDNISIDLDITIIVVFTISIVSIVGYLKLRQR